MKTTSRMTPLTAGILSLLLALLLVMSIAILAYRAWAAFSRSSDQGAVTLQVFDRTTALLSFLKDAETGQRGFLLTGEDRYLEPYRQALTEIPPTLDALDRIEVATRHPDQAQRVARLRPLVKDKLDELGQTIELRRSQGLDAALAIVRTDRGKALMDRIRAVCFEIQTVSRDLLKQETEQARASANQSGMVGAVGSAAVFALLAISTVTIRRETRCRQKLIKSLQESEQRIKEARDWLQTTLASIGDGVITTDASGRVTLLNAVAQSLTGWAQEEAAGKPLEQIFTIQNEETGATVENPVNQVIKEGRIVGLANHTRLTTKQGRQIPIDDSAAPIMDAGGSIAGVVLVFRDVTDRKEAEKANQRSVERFRLMADNAPVLIWMSGIDKLCTWFNKPWLDFAGHTLEQELGNGWAENVHPDDLDRWLNAYVTAFDARRPFKMECRLKRHDGEYRWVLENGTPLYGDRGEFTGYIGSCIDITERKEIEKVLRNSNETLQEFADIVDPVVVLVRDTEDHIIRWSSGAQALYGFTPAEAVGTVSHDLFQTKFPEPLKQIRAKLFASGRWEGELRHKMPNGREIIVSSIWALHRDKNGTPSAILEANTDITHRKRLEEELRTSNEALLRANEDLNQFAFAASHDLQEPLRMITTYSQLLVKGYRSQLEGEAAVCAGFIAEGTSRMRELLTDLLAYTHLTADGQQPVESIDLNSVFQKTIENCKAAIEETQAIVTSEKLPTMAGDEPHFLQLFQNLIGNAIKYRGESTPRIHVSAENQNGTWRFTVADNGLGIDPAYHQRIFGVFKRLHGKTIPGTGIGLAICQRVVERYGGRIWVESQVNQGAKFHFTLPAVRGASR